MVKLVSMMYKYYLPFQVLFFFVDKNAITLYTFCWVLEKFYFGELITNEHPVFPEPG